MSSAQPPSSAHTPRPPSDSSLPQCADADEIDKSESLGGELSTSLLSRNVFQPAFQYNAALHVLDTTPAQAHPTIVSPPPQTPQSSGLRLETKPFSDETHMSESASRAAFPCYPENPQQTLENAGLPVRRSSSVRSVLSASRSRVNSLTPGSAVSSPGVGPLVDITPLPSPIALSTSPGPWRRAAEGLPAQPTTPTAIPAVGMTSPAETINFARTSPKKRRQPIELRSSGDGGAGIDSQISALNAASYSRNRSTSEYVPEPIQIPRPRNVVVSGSKVLSSLEPRSPPLDHLHREEYLAVQRGITVPITKPPTPPKSNLGTDSSDQESPPTSPQTAEPVPFHYEATMIRSNRIRRWRAVRRLGKGTFSTVMLAISEDAEKEDSMNGRKISIGMPTEEEQTLDPKSLVAVKICERGPAGGADEKKIEVSLKRELDILKSIEHPSLVHLKAVNIMEQRALLVLNYCAGGDLFELAVSKPEVLLPGLIRRIFAELVAAVQYLHLQFIVHRDIKLENILVNLPTTQLSALVDLQNYPFPIVTLTDLGLGRWIPKPPDSPLLDTKCGSEDYAAPELLMGQEYDGRATDAWALGVTLYSIMEGRLPFDAIPGARRNSPPKHRIARCEWSWVRYADDDGEWDPVKGKELAGAKEVVEGLLARLRNRWSLEKVQGTEWVSKGIEVEGGLRRIEEDDN